MRISQLSIVVVALIAGLIGGALSGWILSPDKVLEVEILRLVDEQGNLRATLSAKNNDATLLFNDKNGQYRIGIGLFPDGSSGLTLADGAGTVRAFFSQSIAGSPIFSLRDSDENTRLMIASSSEHSGLLIKDQSGKVIWSAP